jgi:hypothetical protein
MRAVLSRLNEVLLSAALVAVGAWPCHAVTINYVGTEPGGAGSGYVTENWSNPAVAKSYATGTSNTYGKDGYWQIRPTNGQQFADAVGGSNDLGTSSSPFPTLTSGTPAFMSSLQGYAGTFVNFSGYPIYRGPDGSSLYQQGALSVLVNQGPYNTPSGPSSGSFGDTLTFVLNYSGTVRVGFAVDSVASGQYAPDYITVFSADTGSTFSLPLVRDGVPDLAVFDIVNPTGQLFSVAQWQLGDPVGNPSAMSLVTFDLIVVPEPSMHAALAIGGVAGGLVIRRRRSTVTARS